MPCSTKLRYTSLWLWLILIALVPVRVYSRKRKASNPACTDKLEDLADIGDFAEFGICVAEPSASSFHSHTKDRVRDCKQNKWCSDNIFWTARTNSVVIRYKVLSKADFTRKTIWLNNKTYTFTIKSKGNIGECPAGWDVFKQALCMKKFVRNRQKRKYDVAQTVCGKSGAVLVSVEDVNGTDYANKTVWVAQTFDRTKHCKVFRPTNNRIKELPCNQKRSYICKKGLNDIRYFGTIQMEGLTAFSLPETCTLGCSTDANPRLFSVRALDLQLEDAASHLISFTAPAMEDQLEFSSPGACSTTAIYWCTMTRSNDMPINMTGVFVRRPKACEFVWLPLSHNPSVRDSVDARVIVSTAYLSYTPQDTDNLSLIWYKDGEVYFERKEPNISIRPARKDMAAIYIVSIETNPYNKEQLGDWAVAVIDDKYDKINPTFNFTVWWQGPPAFCPGQDSKASIATTFGSTVKKQVCFLSAETPESDVNFKHRQKMFSSSQIHQHSDPKTSILIRPVKATEYTLEITIHNVTGADLGNWTFWIRSANGQLQYDLFVKATGAPECPTEMSVTGQTSRSVTISWQPGHQGGAPQYFYLLHNDRPGVNTWERRNVSMSGNHARMSSTVGGLPSNSTFFFRVQSLNNLGYANCSKMLQARTDPPECPPDLEVTGQTSHSVNLTWRTVQQQGEGPQFFVLFYTASTESDPKDRKWHTQEISVPTNTSHTSGTVSGLPASSDVLLRVDAVTEFGKGFENVSRCEKNTVEARTDPPECPPELDVTGQTSRSVNLTWRTVQQQGDGPQFFVLFYTASTESDPKDRKWHTQEISVPTNTSHASGTVSGLPASSDVLLRVDAVTEFGKGFENVSRCEKNTVEARTEPASSSGVHLTVVVGVAVTVAVVVLVLMVVVAAAVLVACKRRGYLFALPRKRAPVLTDVSEVSDSGHQSKSEQSAAEKATGSDARRQSSLQVRQMEKQEDIIFENPVYLSSESCQLRASVQCADSKTTGSDPRRLSSLQVRQMEKQEDIIVPNPVYLSSAACQLRASVQCADSKATGSDPRRLSSLQVRQLEQEEETITTNPVYSSSASCEEEYMYLQNSGRTNKEDPDYDTID